MSADNRDVFKLLIVTFIFFALGWSLVGVGIWQMTAAKAKYREADAMKVTEGPGPVQTEIRKKAEGMEGLGGFLILVGGVVLVPCVYVIGVLIWEYVKKQRTSRTL